MGIKELKDQELKQVSGGKTRGEWQKQHGTLYRKFRELDKLAVPNAEQYKTQQVNLAISKIQNDDDLNSEEKEYFIEIFNKLL